MSEFVEQIDPIGNLMIVRDDEVDRELESGLSLPENARVVIETGTVVRTGPECHPDYGVGTRIVFRPGAGIPVCREADISGAKVLRILSPQDVKCILRDQGVA